MKLYQSNSACSLAVIEWLAFIAPEPHKPFSRRLQEALCIEGLQK